MQLQKNVNVLLLQVSVSLQPEEVLNQSKSPSKNVSKEISSRTMTVARYHEVTLGLTHSQLILPIPLHITPAFEVQDGKQFLIIKSELLLVKCSIIKSNHFFSIFTMASAF